ncbi:Protein phosphatase 1G [Dissostichus eleginoides]|uniref:Protein phosphatase 1G n=1 Tax=Dissostichus eleginoides TaxID=100907 RepID=A0AAD9CKL7_DISEL|nr:Protein phosphatase 1G [Dissostichus eleginoides]
MFSTGAGPSSAPVADIGGEEDDERERDQREWGEGGELAVASPEEESVSESEESKEQEDIDYFARPEPSIKARVPNPGEGDINQSSGVNGILDWTRPVIEEYLRRKGPLSPIFRLELSGEDVKCSSHLHRGTEGSLVELVDRVIVLCLEWDAPIPQNETMPGKHGTTGTLT